MLDFLSVDCHQFFAHLEELQLLLCFVVAAECEDRSCAFLGLFGPLIEETIQGRHLCNDIFVGTAVLGDVGKLLALNFIFHFALGVAEFVHAVCLETLLNLFIQFDK